MFAPIDLTLEATPQTVLNLIREENYSLALILALQLSFSETDILKSAVEAVPLESIEFVVKSLSPPKLKDLFKFLASQIVRIFINDNNNNIL